MLQQTTVAAVIPYYERFLDSFPTLERLAAASEEDVLRHWEGLGYYSRARNIHKTARLVVDGHAGQFPKQLDALTRLPGIGRYTAGAIASFAFDQRAPIVEANTLRLYARLLAYTGDPRSTDGQRLLWSFAEQVLPRKSPGRFNQALMELGATVCTPEQPACDRCPVRNCCGAFASGVQLSIPAVRARSAPTPVTEVAVAIRREDRYLLLKRPVGERWAGLWDFVRFPWQPPAVATARPSRRHGTPRNGRQLPFDEPVAGVERSLAISLLERTGLTVDVDKLLTEIRHTVTRFRITLFCYSATWRAGELSDSACEHRWALPAEMGDFPLSTTGRKLAELLKGENGQRRDQHSATPPESGRRRD